MVRPLDDIREEIDHCSKIYPGFSDIGESLGSIFDAANEFMTEADAEKPMGIPVSQEEADKRFRRGESLCLRPEVDRDLFCKAASIACDGVVAMYPDVPDLDEAVRQFRREFVDEAFTDCRESFDFADEVVTDLLTLSPGNKALGRDLSTFIVASTLSFLYRRRLGDSHELDTGLWGEGNCPVCGQKSHLGLLRDDDGARLLACWLCSTRWVYPRLQCPFCESAEHEELGYFIVESMDICRLHFCRKCNRYLKVFDLRQYQRDDLDPAIHHLATLSYDLAAAREGFVSGSEMQWIDKEQLQD